MPYQERTARIFISSTFRDMHSERDVLVRRVLPELQERCRALNVRILALDLRWGVTKEEAENGKALEICLDEIDRSRPFFIGLLGERYGWVPDTYETANRAKYEWLEPLVQEHHSITALEVIHGVLNNPAQVPQSFFYFRDPAFADDVPTEFRAEVEVESPESATKLAALKLRIRQTYQTRPDNLQSYSCRYDGIGVDPAVLENAGEGERKRLAEVAADGIVDNAEWASLSEPDRKLLTKTGMVMVTGLEVFESLVLEDLWTAIQAQFPLVEDTRTPLQIERDRHEAFMVDACRSFVGRDDTLTHLRQWLDDKPEIARPMLLVGPGGSGKSTVLAKLAQTEPARNPKTLILPVFVGITQGSRDIMAIHKRLIAELNEAVGLNLEIPESMDDLKTTLGIALHRASAGRSVLIVIDAADQLADIHQAPSLAWLPTATGDAVRILVSGLADTAPDQAARLRNLPRLELPLFGTEHARAAVSTILAEYRKELHFDDQKRDQMALLLAKADAGLPLYLQAAAQELRIYPLFDTLSDKIQALPEDLPGLFAHIFERLEQDHSRGLVEAALCLVELSGVGLTESELIELLSASLGSPLAPARWAALRRNLEDVVRGGESADSRYQPYHRVVREGIRGRYLLNEVAVRRWHALLAEAGIACWHPDRVPPPLAVRVVWNLLKAHRTKEASDQTLVLLELTGDGWAIQRVLVDAVSQLVGQNPSFNLETWFTSVLLQLTSGSAGARSRWNDWLLDQGRNHKEEARSGLVQVFYSTAQKAASQALDFDPANTDYQWDLLSSYTGLGKHSRTQGDMTKAKRYFEQELEASQKLVALDGSKVLWQHGELVSYNNLGQLAQAQGDIAGARGYFEYELKVAQRLVVMDATEPVFQSGLSVCYNNLGSLAETLGDAAGAIAYFKESVVLSEKLMDICPTDAYYINNNSTGYNNLGRLALAKGDTKKARHYFEKSLVLSEKLATLYPNNADYLYSSSICYNNLGRLAMARVDIKRATEFFQKSFEIRQKLVTLDSSNETYRSALSIAFSSLGDLSKATADLSRRTKFIGRKRFFNYQTNRQLEGLIATWVQPWDPVVGLVHFVIWPIRIFGLLTIFFLSWLILFGHLPTKGSFWNVLVQKLQEMNQVEGGDLASFSGAIVVGASYFVVSIIARFLLGLGSFVRKLERVRFGVSFYFFLSFATQCSELFLLGSIVVAQLVILLFGIGAIDPKYETVFMFLYCVALFLANVVGNMLSHYRQERKS